jgi:predicted transposase/invertase (TIGR01784 family)
VGLVTIVGAGLGNQFRYLPLTEQQNPPSPPITEQPNPLPQFGVIALTLTDFEMFATLNPVISSFILKEKTLLTDYPINDLELVFVELPKFNKNLEELETLTDKWIYFIKTARRLEAVPEIMAQVPEIRKAFEVANQANLTREELEALEQREVYIHDQRNAIRRALRQGREETRREIAKRMLDIVDEETVSRITGLSLVEVQQLNRD